MRHQKKPRRANQPRRLILTISSRFRRIRRDTSIRYKFTTRSLHTNTQIRKSPATESHAPQLGELSVVDELGQYVRGVARCLDLSQLTFASLYVIRHILKCQVVVSRTLCSLLALLSLPVRSAILMADKLSHKIGTRVSSPRCWRFLSSASRFLKPIPTLSPALMA